MKLKRREWTRQEALGHLVDLATAHQGWFARALVEPRVGGFGYPDAAWARAQRYDLLPWAEVLDLWVRLNQLLVDVLSSVPAERHETPCRVGVEAAVPLRALVDQYVRRVDDVVGEILMRAE